DQSLVGEQREDRQREAGGAVDAVPALDLEEFADETRNLKVGRFAAGGIVDQELHVPFKHNVIEIVADSERSLSHDSGGSFSIAKGDAQKELGEILLRLGSHLRNESEIEQCNLPFVVAQYVAGMQVAVNQT